MNNTRRLAIQSGATEIKFSLQNDLANQYHFQPHQLEAFRKAVEADFVSRCERWDTEKISDSLWSELPPLYTLPKETK